MKFWKKKNRKDSDTGMNDLIKNKLCPKCGGGRRQETRPFGKIGNVKIKCKCNICGYEWEYEEFSTGTPGPF